MNRISGPQDSNGGSNLWTYTCAAASNVPWLANGREHCQCTSTCVGRSICCLNAAADSHSVQYNQEQQ
jgi:hypothetical protein